MKFSPNLICRAKKLGMIYIILVSFCSFFNLKGAVIRPQIRPRKIPVSYFDVVFSGILVTASKTKSNTYTYNTVTVVLLTECIKLCAAFAIYLRE